MKKLFALVVLVSVLFTSSLAAEVDYSSMSLDRLYDIQSAVETEISLRRGNDSIGSGIYVVGTDIKAGRYDFTCTWARDAWMTLQVVSIPITWEDADSGVYDSLSGDEVSVVEFGQFSAGAILSFELRDGYSLFIGGCSGRLTESIHSWAP